MPLAPIEPCIFTFYSFKGGVGRTMALYNCACVLAGSGRRVLMIDLDLEAPGLTYMVKDSEPDGNLLDAQNVKGVVECILDFVDTPGEWTLSDVENKDAILGYTIFLDIPNEAVTTENPGELRLMPAGRLDNNFNARLGRIQWNAKPLSELRDLLFEHIRKVILRSGHFDYVLVDARTGFSEEGYLSTRILADHIVALTGLNKQNIRGTVRFLKQVEAWELGKHHARKVILIESPVPVGEDELKAKRREFFKEEAGVEAVFSLSLPYHPRLALIEDAIVATSKDSELAARYRELTEFLRILAKDSADYWRQCIVGLFVLSSDESGLKFNDIDISKLRIYLETLRIINENVFTQTVAILNQFLPGLPESYDTVSLLRQLSVWLPEEMEFLNRCHILLKRLPGNNLPEIEDILNELILRASSMADTENTERFLIELGCLYLVWGQFGKARNQFEQALQLCNASNNERRKIIVMHLIGNLKSFLGEYPKARAIFEEVRMNSQKNNYDFNAAYMISGFAELDRLEGNYGKALEKYEEALEIYRKNNNKHDAAIAEMYLCVMKTLVSKEQCANEVVDALREVENLNDPFVTTRGWLLVSEVYRAGGDIVASLDAVNHARDLASERGFRGLAADGEALRAVCLAQLGNIEEARVAARNAIAFFEEEEVKHPLRKELDQLI